LPSNTESPSQLTLAWLLKRSRAMIPIPGTSRGSHLEQNVAATAISLSQKEFDAIGAAATSSGSLKE